MPDPVPARPGERYGALPVVRPGVRARPRDFFANPPAADPRYVIRLALEGGFNGIANQIGLAEKFYWTYAGEVPLILKLNGKTDIPDDARALSPVHASVTDAVRLGADAVGYTLYVGTPAVEADFAQLHIIRADAQRYGMRLVVWAYPRGEAIVAKGGKDSFYAVHYAARVASELGADVVKVNFPHPEKADRGPGRVQGRVLKPACDQRGCPCGGPDAAARLRRLQGR